MTATAAKRRHQRYYAKSVSVDSDPRYSADHGKAAAAWDAYNANPQEYEKLLRKSRRDA